LPDLEKSDSDMSKHYNDSRRRDIDLKLSQVFEKETEKISEEELSTFVNNFTKRVYLLKNSIPKSLTHILTGVLNHPNLAASDRDVIINPKSK
jgi:hypothetical protein